MSERPLQQPLPARVAELQRDAADPMASVWVEANAGSGKTRVLTDRVLRLMLTGVPPDQILCLTYTKAAAAEMRQRLSQRLAGWALSPAGGLETELADLLGQTPEPALSQRARSLFVTALETPGGLKIQTIHAFCESLLHRFPTEADVPFDFRVVDDFERDTMVLSARERVIAAGLNGDQRLEGPVEVLFDRLGDHAITQAIDLALGEQSRLKQILADVPGARQRLRRLVRMPGGETSPAVTEAVITGYPFGPEEHAAVLACCPPKPGGSRFEDKLATLEPGTLSADDLFDAYLTKDGLVPKGFPKKAIVDGLPQLWEQLADEAERLAGLRLKLVRARLVERSEALLDLLSAITAEYERDKRARSLLDFDDLVQRSSRLLADKDQSAWVRYKIDGGLTHILVDESQDTNPEQWEVIDALVDEFFEAGGIERHRTMFAVGDGKQSIYSFQGAEPLLFQSTGRKYEFNAAAAKRAFRRVRLATSFRTLGGVLDAVDRVFADEARREAALEELAIVHSTARRDPGGAVTIWPFEQDAKDPGETGEGAEDESAWPLAVPEEQPSAPRRVAERIARTVAGWVGQRPLAARGRMIEADDVLILVQSRSSLFHEIIRALHRAHLPTPGADRLAVTRHIAVLDLMALGDVLLNAEDDLQLAALLRSPLFGLSESDLHAVAQGRKGSLWQALREARPEPAQAAYSTLSEWRGRLDFDRPYTFFAQVLQAEGGLRAFHRRFGREVDDVFAEFLDLALAHEQTAQPSLQGFIAAMRQRDVTIKRELSERGGGVRVMTVHGAKGLEAPIVILADATAKPEGRQLSRPVYLPVTAPGPLLVHAGAKGDHTPETLELRERETIRQQDEYWRKLYVAMTRAEDELYVAGALTKSGKLDGSWYEAILSALRPEAEIAEGEDGRETLIYPRARPEPAPVTRSRPAPQPESLEPAVLAPLPERRAVEIIRPSRSGEAEPAVKLFDSAAAQVIDAEAARRRGLAVHAMLQHLPAVPEDKREAVAEKALAVLLPEQPELHAGIRAQALSILGNPAFGFMFGPGSRAEVPFLLPVIEAGEERLMAGRFDRLVVTGTEVFVIDFKSDAVVPEGGAVPGNYLRQLGLYAMAARQLFPGRHVRAGILWTSLESLLELPRDTLAQAASPFTMR